MAAITPEKKESKIATIKDVIFMYTSVSREVKQLNTENKAPVSNNPLEGHSFEVKILITEDKYKKELKKKFKGAKNFPNLKECTAEEAEETYGIKGLKEDMVLIKFSQSCLTGKPDKRVPTRPIRQIGFKGKVQDLNGVTIDQETSVGNGTLGHFQFYPYDGVNGLYLYPTTVCITELVEYVNNTENDEALGLEELDETDLDTEEANVEDPDF